MAEGGFKLKKPDRIIGQKTTRENLFRLWLEFLLPFHHLTGKELTVAAAYLKERDDLSKVIISEPLIDKILMSDDTQKKIQGECNLTHQNFQVVKNKLRNKKFFVDNRINPRLLLRLKPDATEFSFLLIFPLIDGLENKEKDIPESGGES